MEEKIMHLANFNITFGENDEPMLSHFKDIIFPAFTSKFIRGKDGEIPAFLFDDVQVKEYKKDAFVLVGNYIKQTEYEVHTTIENGALTVAPSKHPTAPYSRFIIFLENHRMILVRNEPKSPDIRSFQTTVRYFLNKFIKNANKELDEKSTLPDAFVNIVDIPLKDDIDNILRNVAKIEWIKLRFFPLNNDFEQLPMASAIRAQMARVKSKTGGLKLNSPNSKEGIKEMITDAAGQATPTLRIVNVNGERDTIKEKSFSSNKRIKFSRDIKDVDDEYLISKAQEDDIINVTSDDNKSWYKKTLTAIRSLL